MESTNSEWKRDGSPDSVSEFRNGQEGKMGHSFSWAGGMGIKGLRRPQALNGIR